MITTVVIAISVLGQIGPHELDAALVAPPQGAAAKALADQVRAAFPKNRDLKQGGHLIARDAVAFVIETSADAKPRVGGMINHSQGLDLVPIGDTGLWARVEMVPGDTKFSYHFEIAGKKTGGATVTMPGWSYPPESNERSNQKYGEYFPLKFRSEVFGNDRTGWIYRPAAYDASHPAALMVFQDGDAYKAEHAGTVVDNLIADKRMPVTVLVLLNPGTNDDGKSNRSVEYDTLSDRYAKFLAEEVLPRVEKDFALKKDAAAHAIGGASSGGICSFTVAWHRPDLFGRVLSQIGSFTNIRGGNVYPDLVRKEAQKPVKVLLTDGTNDLINQYGDWWQANNAMHAALKEKGYDVRFLTDRGFHSFATCGRQLPEALTWLWADKPAK